MSLGGRDEEATDILADVIASMSPASPPRSSPTVDDWGKSFERYSATRDTRIPDDLLHHAHGLYVELCRTQTNSRLLHGDLHHYNTLFDENRGWLAIDPKGVVGEMEYEIGAAFRNPYERPSLFIDAATIEARLNRFVKKLDVEPDRVLKWVFAQAVLSAIWSIEDGFSVDQETPTIRLSTAISSSFELGSMFR
jgi:streptomycin 6-kinase